MALSNVFANQDTKFKKGIKLFYDSTDSILYFNKSASTYTNKVSKAELIDLFEQGLVLVDDGTNLVRPTTLTVSTNYAAVSLVTVASTTASVTSFYSDGYSA